MAGQGEFAFSPERTIWSVSAILARLKHTLDREFFDVWIEGEISNFKQSASRHCYFTLKDAGGQLRAALFAGQARYLKFRPQDGLQVLVRGRLSLYEVRGELQLYVEHLEPLGRGSLQLAFEQLRDRLAAEGLFAADRKRPLPRLPRRIGLITSPRGAVIADLVRILQRRFANLHLLLYPVAVQGETAAGEIAAALDWFAALDPAHPLRPDVLIVGRGGGSLEDLWPFNEEVVARALARSPIPTISAVGHQTDFTIADFVADLRAPTPSAAAELVIRPRQEFLEENAGLARELQRAIRYRLLHRRDRLNGLARHRAFPALRQRLMQRSQAVDELAFRLRAAMQARLRGGERRLTVAATRARHHDPRVRLASGRQRLDTQARTLGAVWLAALAGRRRRLEAAAALLGERNPLELLRRGYALVYDAGGALATSAAHFQPGDPARIRLADGWLETQVRACLPVSPKPGS